VVFQFGGNNLRKRIRNSFGGFPIGWAKGGLLLGRNQGIPAAAHCDEQKEKSATDPNNFSENEINREENERGEKIEQGTSIIFAEVYPNEQRSANS
jgi:hypothetical protein